MNSFAVFSIGIKDIYSASGTSAPKNREVLIKGIFYFPQISFLFLIAQLHPKTVDAAALLQCTIQGVVRNALCCTIKN